jgi:chromosome partitioning protein
MELEASPSYVPEWTRFAETDAAAVSLSVWHDERGRADVRIFAVARHVIERMLDGQKESAA